MSASPVTYALIDALIQGTPPAAIAALEAGADPNYAYCFFPGNGTEQGMVISSFRFVSTYVLAAEQTEPSRWKPVFDRMLSCGADPTLLNGGVECPNDVVQLALSFERLDILEQFGQMPLLLALDRLPAYQKSLPHHAGRPWAPGAAWLEKHYALSEQQSLSEETAPSPRSRAQLPRL